MIQKYIDDNGNPVIIETLTPGVTLIPTGRKQEDAVQITNEEAEDLKAKGLAKNPKPRDLAAEIDALKEENKTLKAEIDKVKANSSKAQPS